MNIQYESIKTLEIEAFIDILKRSSLGKRRPIDDKACIEDMIAHADIIVTATSDGVIVGVARAISDFSYVCYLSDLAVDRDFQAKGIGKKLIEQVRKQLAPTCKIVLLSAPSATEYYPKVGFTQHPSAWVSEVVKG